MSQGLIDTAHKRGTFSRIPSKRTSGLDRDLGRYVSTGGSEYRVIAASAGDKDVISKYLTICKDIGRGFYSPSSTEFLIFCLKILISFNVLELSSGFLSIPTDDWASLIQLTAAHRLEPKPEVGIQQVTYSPNTFFLQQSFYKMGSWRGYLRY